MRKLPWVVLVVLISFFSSQAFGQQLNEIQFLTGSQVEILGTGSATSSMATLDISTAATYGGAIHLYTRSTGTGLYIASSTNNIGIGTTSPGAKLDVVNSSQGIISRFQGGTDDTSYEYIGYYSGTNRQGIMLWDGQWTGCSNAADEFCIKAENGNKLSLYSNGAVGDDILIMPGSGNVGIGTTTPATALNVIGLVRSTDSSQAYTPPISSTDLTPKQYVDANFAPIGGAAGVWKLSGNNLYASSTSYNVGIGRTTPATKLEVYGGETSNRISQGGSGIPYTEFAQRSWGGNNAIFFGAYASSSYINGDFLAAGNTKHKYASTTFGSLDHRAKMIMADHSGVGIYISGLSPGADQNVTWNQELLVTPSNMYIPTNNLGVGEASPGSKLSVSGGATIGATYDTTAAPTNGLLVEGNVGIGTTTPDNPLTIKVGNSKWAPNVVNSSNNIAGGIYIDSLGNGQLRTNNASGTLMNVINGGGNSYFTSGNVGIGTTTPSTQLHVVAASGNAATFSSPITVGYPVAATDAARKDYVDTVAGIAQSASWVQSGSNLYASSTSWNVGVGTTTPSYKLHVVGGGISADGGVNGSVIASTNPTYFGEANSPYLMIAGGVAGTAKDAVLWLRNASTTTNWGLYLDQSDSDKFKIQRDNATPAITINSTGNVGIGTTTPGADVSMTGGLTINGTNNTQLTIQKNNVGALAINVGGTTAGDVNFYDKVGGTYNRAITLKSGNVGIGTSTPGVRLDVGAGGIGTNNEYISINAGSGSGGTPVLRFQRNSVSKAYIGVSAGADNLINGSVANDLIFRTEGGNMLFSVDNGTTAHITLTSAGNVGIGTSTPATKLHLFDASSGPIVTMSGLTNVYRGVTIKNTAGAEQWFYGPDTSNNFVVRRSGTTNDLTINSSGYVGIGTSSQTYPLTVAGTIFSSTGGFRFPDGTTQTTAAGTASQWTSNSIGDTFIFGSSSAFFVDNANDIQENVSGSYYYLSVYNASTSVKQFCQERGYTGGYNYSLGGATLANKAYYNGSSWGTRQFEESFVYTISCGIGKIGIGTSTPSTALEIGDYQWLSLNAPERSNSTILETGILFKNSGSQYLNPSQPNDGAVIRYNPRTNAAGDGVLYFEGYSNGGWKGVLSMDTTYGNVRIGSYGGPSSSKLSVNGNIDSGSLTTSFIGIGTSTPATKLHLFDASSGPIVTMSGLTNVYRGVTIKNTAGAEQWFYGPNTSNNFVIRRGGSTDELTVSSSGGLSSGSVLSLSSATPLQFTNIGSGTYNKTVFYNDLTNGFYLDLARTTDVSGGTPVDFTVTARGGGYNPFFIEGSNGNVGIGTTTPQHVLVVDGDISLNSHLYLQGTDSNIILGSNYLSGDGGDEGIFVDSVGNVGIGDTSPDYKLDVKGTICQDTNGDETCDGTVTSDARLKIGIQRIDSALNKLSKLNGVYFDWDSNNPATEFLGRGTTQVGLVAQDVEKVFPSLVYSDEKGYKMVDYQKLVAPLIESVKELKAENDALKVRIEKLEKKN